MGPRGSGRARATPQIDQRRTDCGRRERPDDFQDQEVVQRPVEQRERGPFARSRERRPCLEPAPPLARKSRQFWAMSRAPLVNVLIAAR